MTKKELLDEMLKDVTAERSQITRLEVETVFESFCNVAAAELLGGGEVALDKVGKLKVVATRARLGRNPRTGEDIQIPAGRKVAFVPFGDFKRSLKA